MKKLLFVIPMIFLVMSGGCITITAPGESQLPTAYIDLISPAEASLGETVSFVGHGTDPDGDIVAYRWRSDIDGDLGVTETLETSSLSAGTHVVYFKVQDNNGNWSDEVRRRVTVSAGASAAANAPVIGSFSASPGIIASGSSSTLSWSISGAATATIDQGIGNVALTGTRVVSPAMTTSYTLTANNAAGSVTATTQVVVSGAAPPPSAGLPVISSFSAVPPIIDAGDSTSLSWNVSNATSVTIDQGVGPVASAGSTPVSPAATTSYTLMATNASGWSSVTIPVVVGAALAAGEPDLVILDISRDGDTIHYTIKNQGLGVAGATTSALLVDGVVKGFDNVGSLAAGAESTESFGYSYACSGLSDTIVVRADKDSVVDESSEANNEYSEGWMCIIIIPPPIIPPVDVTPPTVPVLASPAEGAVLPQPSEPWVFDWGDSADPESGIQQYELYVKWSGGAIPVIDVEVPNSNYSEVVGGSVGAASCSDWRWKVRAQNNAGLWSDWSLTRSFDIELPAALPEEHTVTLFSIVGEDGHVMQGGSTSPYPHVGDRSTGEAMQAFLSFNISGISAGATIKSASLDLSTGDMIGDPFAGLDWMRVYNDQYGNLGAEDFTPGFPTWAMYTYSSPPMAPFISDVSDEGYKLTDAIQAQVNAGAPRFQVRVQFQTYTDGDGQVDCLRFGEGNPKLVVTYEE